MHCAKTDGRDLLESQLNHSQHSFLKSVESNSLFKMSDLKKKEDICQFSKKILFYLVPVIFWTNTNIPDRQQCVQSRKSQKVVNNFTLMHIKKIIYSNVYKNCTEMGSSHRVITFLYRVQLVHMGKLICFFIIFFRSHQRGLSPELLGED